MLLANFHVRVALKLRTDSRGERRGGGCVCHVGWAAL